MGLFGKKADPIENKARALNSQIAALESEIKQLHRKLEKPEEPSPAPAPAAEAHDFRRPQIATRASAVAAKPIAARDPIFESVEQAAPASAQENAPGHFNDLGVRKYDLPGAWKRMVGFFRGPSTHNPKLVSYLAAGSIRGLRPLRYEKRIARNRFIMMSIFFLAILWWLMAVIWKHR
jgi:hypothetical protein